MTLEEWNLAINNAINLWMAGLMTIQTIVLGFATYFGYKQFLTYKIKIKRDHAQKIYLLNKDLNSLLRLVLSRYTIHHGFVFEKEFPYLPKKLALISRSLKIVVDKIWDNNNLIHERLLDISIEVKFLNYPKLSQLFREKNEIIDEVFALYRRNFTMLHEFNNNINNGNDLPHEESSIEEFFLDLPDHYFDENNRHTKRVIELDREIELILLEIIRDN